MTTFYFANDTLPRQTATREHEALKLGFKQMIFTEPQSRVLRADERRIRPAVGNLDGVELLLIVEPGGPAVAESGTMIDRPIDPTVPKASFEADGPAKVVPEFLRGARGRKFCVRKDARGLLLVELTYAGSVPVLIDGRELRSDF